MLPCSISNASALSSRSLLVNCPLSEVSMSCELALAGCANIHTRLKPLLGLRLSLLERQSWCFLPFGRTAQLFDLSDWKIIQLRYCHTVSLAGLGSVALELGRIQKHRQCLHLTSSHRCREDNMLSSYWTHSCHGVKCEVSGVQTCIF